MKKQLSFSFSDVAEVQLIYRSVVPAKNRIKVGCSRDAFQVFSDKWDPETIEYFEEFKLMVLNRSNQILGITTISKGGISGTVIDVRLIFQAALKANASSIIIAHNHPSGNLKPSEADIKITGKIRDAGKVLDIALLDHIILTPEGDYSSLSDMGLI